VEGGVRVRVRGTWTHTPTLSEPTGDLRLVEEFTIVNSELHRVDGGACDQSASLEYVMNAPLERATHPRDGRQ
jgi:hypothetical protein